MRRARAMVRVSSTSAHTKTRGTGSGNDLDRIDGFSVLAVIISYLSRATKKGVWGPLGKVKRIASSVTDLGRRHRGSIRSWGEQGGGDNLDLRGKFQGDGQERKL